MRILFFISSIQGGGAERVCTTIVNELSERGYEVFLSYNMNYPAVYTIGEDVKQINHSVGTKTTKFWSRFILYRLLRTLFNMRKIAKEVKPDIAIGVMSDCAIFTLVALAGLKIPIIVNEHNNLDSMYPQYRYIARVLYRFASAVTVLTRWDYKRWKLKIHNLVYMPNPLYVPNVEKKYNRRKIVLAVGRVGAEQKGFDNLMRCWNMIYKKHPDWKLVVAGKYNEKDVEDLYGLLDDGADSQIEFLGFRTDVYELMLQSEIFVLPSRYEGLPMGLMEAMAAGCCCVAFDVVTGPSDMIINYRSGILVENQNNTKLAEALEEVMTDEKLRHQLASQAPRGIHRFSSDKVINRWSVLFDRIISR
jgi:GalNAc-alpha-(1->4)-GalNAc-alpha-(1->3)-diNAcBac-PP-undecaprenol alpha-1,4-N-acetyl-D-galactosaminyltransferase